MKSNIVVLFLNVCLPILTCVGQEFGANELNRSESEIVRKVTEEEVATSKHEEPFGLEQLNPVLEQPRRTTAQLEDVPNVLFISVDDWNDWVGCLGNEQVQTPNVDRLARRSVLFTNAHCVSPVCNPSRVAVMTGLRPETTGVYENNHIMRRKTPDVVTLSQYFSQHGYESIGCGKIYHDNPAMFDRASWNSYYHWHPTPYETGGDVASPYSSEPDPEPTRRPHAEITRLTKRNFDWASLDRPESDWPDTKVAGFAAEFLTQEHDRPFFLAVGIFRPHVPWFNPSSYVEKYPLEDLVLPTVREDDLDDLGPWARRRALDRASQHESVVAFDEWKPAVQAYLASISFADANVGRVIDALEQGPHRDNTIVVLWSDHGYHLGEKGHWHKRTLWERATRVPFLISVPGNKSNSTPCSQPVSLLDIYPTLVSLCGLDPRHDLEGNDLSPLLEDPSQRWPHPAVTTWQPGNRSVRTNRWRYIRYDSGEEELYDHSTDPNEWHNLSKLPEYENQLRRMAMLLD